MEAPPSAAIRRTWPAGVTWFAGWAGLLLLDGWIDLANQALVLVATAAVATLWLPGPASALAALGGVLAFNWTFVPPRRSFTVGLEQHALLLATMLVVVWIVSALVARQKRAAARAARDADRESRLRTWGDLLRDEADPGRHAGELRDALVSATGGPVALVLLARLEGTAADPDVRIVGEPDAGRREGLSLCVREGRALGPGSGRFEEQPDVYLPLRGRGHTVGAAVLEGFGGRVGEDGLLPHLQALCDQMGLALQRVMSEREAQGLREAARDQATRNALLAAIAHDHRTPLATILGAASSLAEQETRLDPVQRRRLAQGIAEEARRLARLTDNTLQLARLDAPSVQLRRDWEAAEELVGAALQRAARRDESHRLKAAVEPGLPLLWCDAMLMSQLLDNLIDNALKYTPAETPVEIAARRAGGQVVLGVCDRGPVIDEGSRERIFEVFRRGEPASIAGRPGSGIGLAVCRAIAQAHGGTLRLRARPEGGNAFEFALDIREQPRAPS